MFSTKTKFKQITVVCNMSVKTLVECCARMTRTYNLTCHKMYMFLLLCWGFQLNICSSCGRPHSSKRLHREGGWVPRFDSKGFLWGLFGGDCRVGWWVLLSRSRGRSLGGLAPSLAGVRRLVPLLLSPSAWVPFLLLSSLGPVGLCGSGSFLQ